MKDIIYLVVQEDGVKRMTKNIPQLYSGEFPLKLIVEVEPEAFRNPILTKKVVVNDWREGIDIADVNFKETFITEQEAELIKKQRIERMEEILKSQGYVITKPEKDNSNDPIH